jgi:hypothetical protein
VKSEKLSGAETCAIPLINQTAPAAGWFMLVGGDDLCNRVIVPDSVVGA